MRIDKYLKVCRLIKRRTMANQACTADRILVNGKPAKPSKDIKEGDTVTVCYGNKTITVRVLNTNEKARKEEAAAMYEVIDEN